MGLETGTFIDDLVTTNPPGTDLKSQGDDHIRLIKAILRATFPRAGKAFYFPQNLSKSADFTVLATEDKSTFSVDTVGGAITLTLPTLAVGDAGWSIEVIKTSVSSNPIFIVPPSGLINNFSKVRRTLEFMITKVVWNGSTFYASRPNGGVVGESRHFYGTILPNDCVWPDGTTFVAANYVELNSVLGGNTKPDIRGRSEFCRDNAGGVTAGRISIGGSNFNGTILGAGGGAQSHTLTVLEIPTITPTGSIGGSQTINVNTGGVASGGGGGGFQTNFNPNTAITIFGSSFPFTGDPFGGGGAHSILSPAIIANVGIVAE